LVFRLDSNSEFGVLESDSCGGLFEELSAVGKDETFVGFLLAELTDKGAEKGGFSGAGGHDHEDAVEALVFAGEYLSESLGLVGAQKDLGDFHRNSYRRWKPAV
jgi:hypothetical protein